MKKYVLTGGPGTGKSSILLALELRCEQVIREAAEDYIRYRQACGEREPWLNPEFQENIFEIQKRREDLVQRETERVFIDRGVADGAAYLDENSELYKKVLEEAKSRDYTKIFLITQLDVTERTAVRREDRTAALKLGEKIKEIYTNLGCEVITIEPSTVEERVQRILEEIKK